MAAPAAPVESSGRCTDAAIQAPVGAAARRSRAARADASAVARAMSRWSWYMRVTLVSWVPVTASWCWYSAR